MRSVIRGRHAFALGIAACEAALAAVVLAGMVTGRRRQFEKGVAPLFAVVAVQVLGAVALIVLALGIRACLSRRNEDYPRALVWFACGLALCAVWAFVRVGEYAS